MDQSSDAATQRSTITRRDLFRLTVGGGSDSRWAGSSTSARCGPPHRIEAFGSQRVHHHLQLLLVRVRNDCRRPRRQAPEDGGRRRPHRESWGPCVKGSFDVRDACFPAAAHHARYRRRAAITGRRSPGTMRSNASRRDSQDARRDVDRDRKVDAPTSWWITLGVIGSPVPTIRPHEGGRREVPSIARRDRLHGRRAEYERGVLLLQKAARLVASPTSNIRPGFDIAPRSRLGATFGRGAMTNHWVDVQNCKTILVEGSNVAENDPMALEWIRKAQGNGATIIDVDPRYTRTSAAADVYARIRPGTDVAFENAMISHIIVNKLYDEDYVITHTDPLYLGDEAFSFKDGVFSGYDESATPTTPRPGDTSSTRRASRVLARSRRSNCVSATEDLCLALHALDGRADDRHRHRGRDRRDDGEERRAPSMRWDGRSMMVAEDPLVHHLELLLETSASPGGVNVLRGEPNVQARAAWRCSTR